MAAQRDWTVLMIGGPSGTGKTSVAHALGRRYGINVVAVDDIFQAVKAMTSVETHPAVHYWSTGVNWLDIGLSGNMDWLLSVGEEMAPALRAVVESHLEEDLPVILEGDFLLPAFAASIASPAVKSLFVLEADKEQLVQNFMAREGGEAQYFRAEVSVAYGKWLQTACAQSGVPIVEARPWNTVAERAKAALIK